jgi:hypothetical protein
MGDLADQMIDDAIQLMADGGYCEECEMLCDPQGPCGCDDTWGTPKRKARKHEKKPCR